MKKTKKLFTILLAVVLLCQAFISNFCITASALYEEDSVEPEIAYTNAYNDLKSNSNFNPDDYPKLDKSHPDYYKLEVITIAESENGELFVYVYQPSSETVGMRASHITISCELSSDLNASGNYEDFDDSFKVYELSYINHYGQFYKYKVDGLEVFFDEIRCYEITDILRPFNKEYGDIEPGGDNTISAIPYAVGKLFTFVGSSFTSGYVTMSVQDIEYITLTDKYVGYIKFEQDDLIYDYSIDLHFLAFSTETPIDKLLEATVYYETQDFRQGLNSLGVYEDYGEIESHHILLNDESYIEYEVSDGSLFKESFKLMDQIQSTGEFLSQKYDIHLFPGFTVKDNLDFTEDARLELLKTDWVLTFAKTADLTTFSGNGDWQQSVTRVGNVKLLRLKFETDGKIYDLGVVDNMQTGSMNPAAVIEEQDWWQKLVALIMLVILILVLMFFLDHVAPWFGAIFKAIFKVIGWVLSSIFDLLTWPFRAIDKNIKSSKRRAPSHNKSRKKKSK